jgi:hypothetical protein
MPVQYRDFATNLQAANNPISIRGVTLRYVIVPRSNHTSGSEIVLAPAPMSHPSVQECLCDARYTSLASAQAATDRAFKLRSKLLTDKGTYRIPFKESALTHYGTVPHATTESVDRGSNSALAPLPSGNSFLQLTQAAMSFWVHTTLSRRTHRMTHSPVLSICQEHSHRQGKDRPQTTMPKASANKTAQGAASRLKPNALIWIRTAKRVKANPLRLTSRVSETRTFRSYGSTMYKLTTICTNKNLYQKRCRIFLRKIRNPFGGNTYRR